MTTSDRIAVMNKGRIEQIDDPLTLYTRPKTRYVAEFIGRSNILDGKPNGSSVAFNGFEVASARLGCRGPIRTSEFSLRSQNLALHAACPAGDASSCPAASPSARFSAKPGTTRSAPRPVTSSCAVMSPPVSVFTMSARKSGWRSIPSHIIPIQDDQHA